MIHPPVFRNINMFSERSVLVAVEHMALEA